MAFPPSTRVCRGAVNKIGPGLSVAGPKRLSQGESSHVRRPNRGDTSEISSIKGFPTKSRGSTDSSKVSAEVTPCTRQGKEYAYVETARGRKEVAPRGSCPTGQEVKLSGA